MGILICFSENGCFELTNNMVWFSRTYVQFINNSCFDMPIIMHDVEQAICDVLLRFINHIIGSLRGEKFKNEVIL